MTGTPRITVIIRARDEATNLERCLSLLAGQRVEDGEVEVVVVDGGSRDRTVATARAHGARVVELLPSSFSYGRALNLGAANARGEVLVALSAHAYPLDSEWLSRMTATFAESRVACASGDAYGPDGEPLTARLDQDLELARRRPEWGYSNAAGAVRAELWRARPFRDDLPGCEDKEWAWHWLRRSYVCAIDPALVVDHDHTHDSLRSVYHRARREWEGLAAFAELEPWSRRELAQAWWQDLRWYDSASRARLSHRRAARLLGTYAGRRSPPAALRGRAGRGRARRSAGGS